MKAKDLRDILSARPFKPFNVVISDGRSFPVPHPDYLFFPPMSDTLIIAQSDGGVQIVGLNHVTRVDLPKRTRRAA